MTEEEFVTKLTPEQRESLISVWRRTNLPAWAEFRESACAPSGRIQDYVTVPFAGMILGIEADGYTHS